MTTDQETMDLSIYTAANLNPVIWNSYYGIVTMQ